MKHVMIAITVIDIIIEYQPASMNPDRILVNVKILTSEMGRFVKIEKSVRIKKIMIVPYTQNVLNTLAVLSVTVNWDFVAMGSIVRILTSVLKKAIIVKSMLIVKIRLGPLNVNACLVTRELMMFVLISTSVGCPREIFNRCF